MSGLPTTAIITNIAAYCFNGLYVGYLIVIMALYFVMLPFIFLFLKVRYGGKLDDILRRYNRNFGKLVVRMSWPIVRLRLSGIESLPNDRSCVVVVNHRSTSDVIFTSFFTPFNTVVFMNAWTFKIVFLKWFIRGAGYVNTQEISIQTFLEAQGESLKERNVSFLFFPEGHRSPSAELQFFRSGAFQVATALDIPVIPVCLSGTEKFVSMHDHFVRPAVITVKILDPVHASLFEGKKRVWKMKKHVEALVRGNLNEFS